MADDCCGATGSRTCDSQKSASGCDPSASGLQSRTSPLKYSPAVSPLPESLLPESLLPESVIQPGMIQPGMIQQAGLLPASVCVLPTLGKRSRLSDGPSPVSEVPCEANPRHAPDRFAQRSGKGCGRKLWIGIDLGTATSSAAYVNDRGQAVTIPVDGGYSNLPSVVYFETPGPRVGRAAVRFARENPSRMIRFAKRHLGRRLHPKEIMGRRLPPLVIQALILKKLKADVEKSLGAVPNAAISVPAHFTETCRSLTRDAARLAGFEQIRIVNDPTAAAVAFGAATGRWEPTGSRRHQELVLVFDLGGGTFDATLLETDGKRFDAIVSGGNNYLGGMDWDRRLVNHLADCFQKATGSDLRRDDATYFGLTHQAESTRICLSDQEQTIARIEGAGKSYHCHLARTELERMTSDLLDQTRMVCVSLLQEIGLGWSDLDRLILVGGAARMPAVRKMLQKETGLPVHSTSGMGEAVAQGAALIANLETGKDGQVHRVRTDGTANPVTSRESVRGDQESALRTLKVTNISSHDLGIRGKDPATGRPCLRVMIPRNSPLPAAASRQFLTARDGQRTVCVQVLEGGGTSVHATARSLTQIGECRIEGLPPGLPRGTCVLVTFRYSADGRLAVEAALPDIDRQASTTIVRDVGLEPAEFEFWKRELEKGFGWKGGTGSGDHQLNEKHQNPSEQGSSPHQAKNQKKERHNPVSQVLADSQPGLFSELERFELDDLLDACADDPVDSQVEQVGAGRSGDRAAELSSGGEKCIQECGLSVPEGSDPESAETGFLRYLEARDRYQKETRSNRAV